MNSEAKLHQAKIAGQIQGCYSNFNELTTPIILKSEFETSLKEGEMFYEESIVKSYCSNIQTALNEAKSQEDKDYIRKGADDVLGALNKRIVLDEKGNQRTVYIKNIQKSKDESNIEKGGEGSKGGKVIGHTKSGKPIYDSHDHESHKHFTSEDHKNAADLHTKIQEKNEDKSGEADMKNYNSAEYHDSKSKEKSKEAK